MKGEKMDETFIRELYESRFISHDIMCKLLDVVVEKEEKDMADAKKCDRCGNYYDENNCKIDGCILKNIRYISVDGYIILEFDLCDDCFKKLKKFMTGGERYV